MEGTPEEVLDLNIPLKDQVGRADPASTENTFVEEGREHYEADQLSFKWNML